ncbi:MAG: hypothetical protein KDE22_08170, partial [Rhodobacterales bacterium]|nr:hypothetical protein [Rhodobacterales bacterium]
MAWLTPVLLVLACLGLGGLTLRLAGVAADLDLPQRLAWAFGLGFGLLGWLLFPVGIAGFYGTVGTVFVLALSALCGLAWRGMAPVPAGAGAAGADDGVWGGWLTIVLVVALAMVMALDLVEGLAPPTE